MGELNSGASCSNKSRRTEHEEKNGMGRGQRFRRRTCKEKTKGQQISREPSNKQFAIELVIFTALVVSYFFLVLSFLPHWLKHLFDQNKLGYALVAWALIAIQGVVLEILAVAILKVIRLETK